MMKTRKKMYKAPEHFFKPENLHRDPTYWVRFVPFVLRPDFIRSLMKAMFDGKMEMDVPCWSSTPPLYTMNSFDLALHTNLRTGVRSQLFPIINKAHALAYRPGSTIEIGALSNYDRMPNKVGKTDPLYTAIVNYHKELCLWHERVRKTSITLNMNDVLALLQLAYSKYSISEAMRVPMRTRDSGTYVDYLYAVRNNKFRFTVKRLFARKPFPSLSPHFSINDLHTFLTSCFRRKYKKDLNVHLRDSFGIELRLIAIAGVTQSLTYDKSYSFYLGLANRLVPAGLVDNGDGSRHFFKCACCNKLQGGPRVIYPVKHEPLFGMYSETSYKERVRQRQLNPAKYSSNPIYREDIKTKPVEKEKDLSPFKKHIDKFGGIEPYVKNIATALNTHYKLLDGLSKQDPNKRKLPVGGYLQSSHTDEFEIDHYAWERKEHPVSKDLKALTDLPDDKLSIFVCKACSDWVTYWVHKTHKEEETTVRLEIPRGTRATINVIQAGTLRPLQVLQNDQHVALWEEIAAPSPPVPKEKRVIPRYSKQIYVITDHRANPLEHCDKSFLLAPGENKKIQKVPVYDTKGKLVGVRSLDRTLYMGIELEVTPSQEATKFLEGAIEIPLMGDNESHFYYQETKHVSSMVASTFFYHNRMAIIKHDGSTANGFEIVSVPGTHKWHTEQGWNGFFQEDYEDALLKELAPSTWLCGWANNGGRSNNPIYRFYGPEGRRPVCGIHIHVSRDAISPLTLGKLLHFTTNPQSLKFIQDIAGRNERKYAKIIPQKVKDGKILHTINSGTGRSNDYLQPERKYEALNIHTGKPTIEFRIFRSNVSKAGFMKNIDFVHALVTWCQQEASLDFEKLTVDNFIAWCNTQRGVYKYLTQWLVQKKYLSTIHQFNPKYHNPIVFEDENEANEEKVA